MSFEKDHFGFQSAFAHLPPEQLFEEMITMIGAITSDHRAMIDGLKFLLSEAKKPRMQRNEPQIRVIWDRIQPLLRTYGIMDHFDREPMRGKMLFFLRSQF